MKKINANQSSILGKRLDLKQDKLTAGYNDLTNKPSINNVTLSGNKSLSDLGINSKVLRFWTSETEYQDINFATL